MRNYAFPVLTLVLVLLAGCVSSQEKQTYSAEVSRDVRILSAWPREVRESSGLAVYGKHYWTHNDSGDVARIYALNAQHQIEKRVLLRNTNNVDWEEFAQDESALYLFDCGNNKGKRNQLQVHKLNRQELQGIGERGFVQPETLNFEYADKPAQVSSGSHNYDCEAATVVGNKLWLFTKNRGDLQTTHYILDKDMPEQSLSPVAKYPVEGLITSADYDVRSATLALLGYEKSPLFGQSFVWLIPVSDKQLVWSKAERFKLKQLGQWEAVKWDWQQGERRLLLTTETTPFIGVSLGEVLLPVGVE